ncbi:DUF5777 family beta-barrel protein [Cesiribacter andamanensis]|uniref:DUF5777 family beta-barrel protein n=1 Tax=Cesiribacter andamanensis TaxID=649507 RepID=UPI00034A4F23|nr:DUF5777 family beta-barrel protein [Cesiribacter andamanensis]
MSLLLICLFAGQAQAQDDLLSLIEEETPEETVYATAGFKSTRVINGHSFENTAGGVLDVRISHRFGYLNSGAYNLWGLDNATIRIGADYGITDWLMIGLGRSSVGKTYDGFAKWKFLRQSSGARSMPLSAALVSTIALETLKWAEPERENYFSSRLSYTHQLILGRKFSESFSLQLMPTLVHRNLIPTEQQAHDVLVMGAALRQKLSKRVALNAEYFYVLPDQLEPLYRNSFSLGFDIETGGHVFQLHFTNSTAMIERGFITQTTGNWLDGDIHFGFNISRVFTIRE